MHGARPARPVISFQGCSVFNCRPLLNIHDVVVAGKYRGQGLSKHPPAAVEEMAVRPRCCKLTLEVPEGNLIAQAACLFLLPIDLRLLRKQVDNDSWDLAMDGGAHAPRVSFFAPSRKT